MRTEILLYDGFDELDAVGPYEVLSGARFDTAFVTLDGAERITGSHGAELVPHARIGDSPALLVIPGGGWSGRSRRGAWAEAERGAVPAAIAERHAAGSTIAAVCTGGMLVARAGLLEGRPAVTHHSALDDLAAAGADVKREARVVDDGDILTAGGVTSGIDLALWLVEREHGTELADRVAAEIEHTRSSHIWRAGAPA